MIDHHTDSSEDISLVDFLERFVASRQFQEVFEEGMRLVEETADYLDGPGRAAARKLSRDDAIIYATESMRLTTRLMQMASWLLLQRAAASGEVSEQECQREQENIALSSLAEEPAEENIARLPEELAALTGRAQRLYEQILRLDAIIGARQKRKAPETHPVSDLLARLQAEFSREKGDS